MRMKTLEERIEMARMGGDKMSFRIYSCLKLAAESMGVSERAMLDMYLEDWLDERKIVNEFDYEIDWPEEFDEEDEE